MRSYLEQSRDTPHTRNRYPSFKNYKMSIRITIYIFLTLLFVGCKGNEFNSKINSHQSKVLQSEILNEEREILISIPEFEYSEFFGELEYPVIYVLDGEEMFEYVSAMVNFLSGKKGNRVLPPSIVVGIVNTNRTENLTHDPISFEPESGGGSKFSQFIEDELFKYIGSNYRVKNHRTLIGHSYGGLFALNIFFRNPNMFDNYIALDPSYQYMLNKELAIRSQQYNQKQIYIGIANTLIAAESSKNNQRNNHYNSLIKLCNDLKKKEEKELQIYCNIYEDDNHSSLCIDATHKALRKMFSWYDFDFSKATIESLNEKQIDNLLNKYNKILSSQFKENSYVSEQIVNQIAFYVKDESIKLKLLKRNLANHPKSFNANFSLGRYYRTKGKIDTAKYYLEKAISINKDEVAIKELKEIKTMGNNR